MTTTTFKSVGGTSKSAEEPAAKPAKGKGKAAAAAKPQKKPAKVARQSGTIIIKGKPLLDGSYGDSDTIPLVADGALRHVQKGVPVKVSEAELAFIKRSGIKFS